MNTSLQEAPPLPGYRRKKSHPLDLAEPTGRQLVSSRQTLGQVSRPGKKEGKNRQLSVV